MALSQASRPPPPSSESLQRSCGAMGFTWQCGYVWALRWGQVAWVRVSLVPRKNQVSGAQASRDSPATRTTQAPTPSSAHYLHVEGLSRRHRLPVHRETCTTGHDLENTRHRPFCKWPSPLWAPGSLNRDKRPFEPPRPCHERRPAASRRHTHLRYPMALSRMTSVL